MRSGLRLVEWSFVTPEEMEQVRPVVVEFAGRMLADLPRKDQRAKGETYVRGLMVDGKRKSVQPMAERLGADRQGVAAVPAELDLGPRAGCGSGWRARRSSSFGLRPWSWTKLRWRVEHDHRELKDGLGLDHFEGRSWVDWHRHGTLACLAQAMCTQLRRTPKAPAPA